MGTTTPTSSEASVTRATPVETLLTLVGGIWLIVGLFVDGYAHSEIIDTETEDFFTPWHALFYSGFAFSAGVIAWMAVRRSSPAPIPSWLPPGYGLAAVGVGIFAVGGVGDGIWHTVFGVENGVDALLSPTHLLLFLGMLLILTAPVRAAWLDPTSRGTWGGIGGALASAAIASGLIVFFFVYAFGLRNSWWHGLPFDPQAGSNFRTMTQPDGSLSIFRDFPETSATEDEVSLALAHGYVATVLLLLPVLGLLRRWRLPPGSVALLWGLPVLLQTLAFDGDTIAVPAVLVGAVVSEATMAASERRLGRSRAIAAGMGLGMTVTWAIWMALVHLTAEVRWPPELWFGQIMMSGFLALAVAVVAFPPSIPGQSAGTDAEPVPIGD